MSFDTLDVALAQDPAFEAIPAVVDPTTCPPRRARRARKTPMHSTPVALVLKESFSDETLAELVECATAYAQSLRVVMLRLMIKTPALGQVKGRAGYHLAQMCEFLGFENFDDFTEPRTLVEIRKELGKLLAAWEKKAGTPLHFPQVLQDNLQALGDIIGLNALEKDILGLGVLIHGESKLEHCLHLLGSELAGYNIERVLAPLLGQKPEAVAQCLQRSGKLAHSGLLSIDLSNRYGLRQLIDLLTPTFAARMLMPQPDIRQIIEGFVRPAGDPALTVADYAHVQTNLGICKSLLGKAARAGTAGVNVLIYGKPGSGKTELARLLAHELGLQLMEVTAANLAGAPVTPIRRLRAYRIAQAFFQHDPTVILLDECEEVLAQRSSSADSGDDEASVPRKSWINKMLETNEVPTIWIANAIRHFDEAYMRRFSVCFEMPAPSQEHRGKMLDKAFHGLLGEQARLTLARNKEVTPGMLVQTARVIHAVAGENTGLPVDALAIHLVNNSLKAQSKSQIHDTGDLGVAGRGFEPSWVNCEVDLQGLCGSIRETRVGRLCLYGPPGTGKTAFGQWVAQQLDVPHLVIKASELLSPYVGEAEKNIARAFEAARQQNALLQFDEVDSFLQDRRKASKQWEVTQVNEMLTQMEGFQGVFIASTNLFENLDDACLRRFDLTVRFDFMKPQAAWAMFVKTCEVLGVSDASQVNAQRLHALRQLTPGDFEQVVRRARLLRPATAQQVLAGLQAATALKKSVASGPIGFLALN